MNRDNEIKRLRRREQELLEELYQMALKAIPDRRPFRVLDLLPTDEQSAPK